MRQRLLAAQISVWPEVQRHIDTIVEAVAKREQGVVDTAKENCQAKANACKEAVDALQWKATLTTDATWTNIVHEMSYRLWKDGQTMSQLNAARQLKRGRWMRR